MKRHNLLPHVSILLLSSNLLAGCPADDTVASDGDDSSTSDTPTSDPSATMTTPTSDPATSSDPSSTSSSTTTEAADSSSTAASNTTETTSSSSGGSSSSSDSSSSSSTTSVEDPVCGDGAVGGSEECDDANDDNLDGCLDGCVLARSCAQILAEIPEATDGVYAVDPDDQGAFPVLCDMTTDGGGWTLAARFANGDNVDNWMLDDGGWWFDLETEQGNTGSTAQLADMLSATFWRIEAQEFKITRSDNEDNAHILMTTGDCLGGDTFRGFITSLGYDNSGPWAIDGVLASCDVLLGGNYAETSGFAQAECADGDIGGANTISFWANWNNPDSAFAADSAVMMIGGGGQACARADHGLGITEENDATFAVFGAEFEGTSEADFGNDGFPANALDYGLNIFVR